MNQTASTRNYDLFKLIVALILLILLLWLLLRGTAPATPVAVASVVASTSTSAPGLSPTDESTATSRPVEPSATLNIESTDTSEPVEPGAAPTAEPSETSQPTLTPTAAPAVEQPPTETPTTAAEQSPTETPTTTPTPVPPPAEQSPTETPTATPEPIADATATETPAAVSGQVDCPLALPARLKAGDTARVTSNLNMRSAAGIGNSLILTNLTGTQLTILGGPVCEPYQGGAYLWWQVQRSDGQTGWSAEGTNTGSLYFLEPIQ